MKRSTHVAAPLLAATALAITTGCHGPEMQRCVDEHNHVVADSFCQQQGQVSGQRGYVPGFGGYPGLYRY